MNENKAHIKIVLGISFLSIVFWYFAARNIGGSGDCSMTLLPIFISYISVPVGIISVISLFGVYLKTRNRVFLIYVLPAALLTALGPAIVLGCDLFYLH